MQELLKNAWLGWQNYIGAGKYIVFVIAVLLLFWLQGSKNNTKRMLFIYGTIMTLACICPVTAAVLMKYQTGFYDYQWIWSIVPVTMIIGVGFVGMHLYHEDRLGAGSKAVIAFMMVAIMALAGRMGAPIEDVLEREQLEITKSVLADVTEKTEAGEICLWAPQEIMMYARAVNAEIVLPYGRDMWDGHLGAYSYDTYASDAEVLYQYMSGMEIWGEYNPSVKDAQGHTIVLQGDEYLKKAVEMGVTHILLPQNAQEETVYRAEQILGVSAYVVEDYYLFILAR